MDEPLSLSPSGPAESIIPPMPGEAQAALKNALKHSEPSDRKKAVSQVIRQWPTYSEAWAELAALADEPVEAYAYFRVGYHRGLDQLRQSGWRGSGFVRSSRPENRGFLEALRGLGQAAGRIGETDEEQRCQEFANQLDP
ncbi:MAG: DUF3151 domain-containing protein [Acidimicrobiia bacterium]|nr:DUF3151 domain-containing protein [Acidimicrobiia bacterium]NNL28926.1 DUF3151 family protein [Acidimicrobiia bacterium]